MKKKAFTLTELLVVVVIIGVLSAVVLPKFTKVLQTRKTTEAENVMAAVRNEQEARCMVGRNYVGQNEISKLASLPKATSKNYTYTLGAQGITATAKDGNYTLQIPSYADGRICCSGEGCEKLNKDYPTCNDTFLAAIDQSACEAPEVPENPDPDLTPADCVEGNTRNVTAACGQENGEKCEGGKWVSYTKTISFTEAEKQDCTKCDGPWPENNRDCPEGYNGSQSRQVSCDKSTGRWSVGEWEGMEMCAQEEKCEEDDTRDHEPYTECLNGCGEYVDVCYGGTEWQPECRWKASVECTGDQTKTEEEWRVSGGNRQKIKINYRCEQCKWVEDSTSCGTGYVEIEGLCCKEGQIVKNGKCMYSYRPERIEYSILAECAHGRDWAYENDNGSVTSACAHNEQVDCTSTLGNAKRYYGGSASRTNVLKTENCYFHPNTLGGCDMHIGGWSGGTEMSLAGLANGQSEQDFCDQVCGRSDTCNMVVTISENYPTRCESFSCAGYGPYCGWAVGSGVGMRCVRN